MIISSENIYVLAQNLAYSYASVHVLFVLMRGYSIEKEEEKEKKNKKYGKNKIQKQGEKTMGLNKEVIKEQPTPTNLSATARRVLQCTRSQWPSCSFKERFFGYSHHTIPETPSQIGFISV